MTTRATTEARPKRGQDARRTEVPDDKKLLTYHQVAEMFGVDPRTVKRWRAAGKLKPITMGHRIVRFRAPDIEALIKRSGG